jgi:hypothetical protein
MRDHQVFSSEFWDMKSIGKEKRMKVKKRAVFSISRGSKWAFPGKCVLRELFFSPSQVDQGKGFLLDGGSAFDFVAIDYKKIYA